MTHVSNTGRKIPMPAPLPPMGGKPKTPDSKIEQDFSESSTRLVPVDPHTTRAGFLFYDMEGLGGNPLRGVKLRLRELRDARARKCIPSIFRSISIWTQGTRSRSDTFFCGSQTYL